MKYPKTIIDERSGIEVPNELYKAYQDGQMSVVDWVGEHRYQSRYLENDVMLSVEEWQAKLRDWGLGDYGSK